MSSQNIGGLKVPSFDKTNYSLWKKRMLLYLRAADSRYIKILQKGPYIFEEEDPDVEEGIIPRNPDTYTNKEIELDGLDAKVQDILMEALDDDMRHQIVVCEYAKYMWLTIELLMEGKKDVRENRLDILTTQYEAFKSLPGEGITSVFERLNKLINELSLHVKKYPQKEINRKFMLTLPQHLDNKATSVRERLDFKTMSLEKLYGKMKTREMEQEHKKILYGSNSVDVKNAELLRTTTLVTSGHKELDITVERPRTNAQVLLDGEMDDGNLSGDPSDYYTMEEL